MFAGIKNIRKFVVNYNLGGGNICLLLMGIFYAYNPKYNGSIPPCNPVIGLLPLRCNSTGKVEPFFISAINKLKKAVMNYAVKKSLNRNTTSLSNAIEKSGTLSSLFSRASKIYNLIVHSKQNTNLFMHSVFRVLNPESHFTKQFLTA